jgi:hypothetical protein
MSDAGTWTHTHTRAWLSAYPLPADFTWPDRDGQTRPVLPSHRSLSGGYGKWLHETPYFPGLFELAHEILRRAPADAVLTPEWLANELKLTREINTKTLL